MANKTKGQHKAKEKKAMRRKEEISDASRDIMQDRALRRGWGKGIAKGVK